jgi:hypothetical protein
MGVVAVCGIFWSDRPNPDIPSSLCYRYNSYTIIKISKRVTYYNTASVHWRWRRAGYGTPGPLKFGTVPLVVVVARAAVSPAVL